MTFHESMFTAFKNAESRFISYLKDRSFRAPVFGDNIELDDKKIDKDEEQLDTPDPIITGKYNGGVHDFGPMTYLVPLIVPPYSNSYSNFYLEQNKLIKEQTDAIISLSKKIDKFEDRLQDLEEKL